MKTKLLSILALLGLTLGAQAQDFEHEVGAFYGLESASNIFSIITSSILCSS